MTKIPEIMTSILQEINPNLFLTNSFRKKIRRTRTETNMGEGGGKTNSTYSPNASRAGRPHILPSVPSAMVSASTICRPVRWKAAGSNSHDSGERHSRPAPTSCKHLTPKPTQRNEHPLPSLLAAPQNKTLSDISESSPFV
jgi:hypothetical protein